MSANANSTTIDFFRPFNNNKGAGQTKHQGSNTDRPKSRFWINIGYDSGVLDEYTGNNKFVSLPAGIPLDGQERVNTNSRNAEFAAFQSARNDLLAQIMAVAENLQPGEEKLLQLQVQLRRVNDEAEEIPATENAFSQAAPKLL